MKLFPEYLSGEYVLAITTINTGNPTACRLFEFLVDGKTVERNVLFPESSGTIELKLWKKHKDLKIQLVGYHKSSVIREIALSFQITQKSATLEDKYSKRQKKLVRSKLTKRLKHIHLKTLVFGMKIMILGAKYLLM